MLKAIGQRLLAMIPLIIIATILSFSLQLLVPGDPAAVIAGEGATAEQVEIVRKELGFDKSPVVRYASFLGNLAQGDLGNSYRFKVPVTEMIVDRLPATLSLTLVAMLFALLLGVPVGIMAGRRPGKWQDRLITSLSTLGLAIPNFVLGLFLVLFVAIRLRALPATGYAPLSQRGFVPWFRGLILPGLSLGVLAGAEIARQLRASMVDVLQQDYVRTAVAKGMREKTVVWKHALKNALMPVVTAIGMQVAYLLGGTAVVESVFGIKGLGDFAIQAVLGRDLPAIQGMVVFAVTVTLVASLLVDLSYNYLNPRSRER